MNTMVQSVSVKPRSDKVRQAAQTVFAILTEKPFFNWKWVAFDLLVIGVWIIH